MCSKRYLKLVMSASVWLLAQNEVPVICAGCNRELLVFFVKWLGSGSGKVDRRFTVWMAPLRILTGGTENTTEDVWGTSAPPKGTWFINNATVLRWVWSPTLPGVKSAEKVPGSSRLLAVNTVA